MKIEISVPEVISIGLFHFFFISSRLRVFA